MTHASEVGLDDVREVYSGPEGDLWELIMGHQIHIGGLTSSTDLVEKAAIEPGTRGVDFCCCNGAGMRFLLRFREVAYMTGVDATETVIERGRQRCAEEGLSNRVEFVNADVCDSGLPDDSADFVWGEDAWCYVVDKPKLIAEANRIVRPGGVVAFTDWITGSTRMQEDEGKRFGTFMKFPNIQGLEGYCDLLEQNDMEIVAAEDTGRFAPYMDLYLNMLTMQLTYDALRIINFDEKLWKAMGEEMAFMRDLAHDGKIAQGLFIARKK